MQSKHGICSIKDQEHEHRKSGKSSANIKIEEKVLISARSQELFLSNEKNKEKFVDLLRHYST